MIRVSLCEWSLSQSDIVHFSTALLARYFRFVYNAVLLALAVQRAVDLGPAVARWARRGGCLSRLLWPLIMLAMSGKQL